MIWSDSEESVIVTFSPELKVPTTLTRLTILLPERPESITKPVAPLVTPVTS